ncbi:hypothetical protein NLB58_00075 [Porphyromonas gingivalis]|uniref:hypothetical protein n=1 Tax=Porphyromonas gingivalis TaxID=837 RepID=UPI00265848C1|nr:hypothetical protein [Porphyromonas gingivalis]MDP0530276.1 hypothetical protein [Porphyromonas gingivalis]MDP0625788.1 hypothetical protein [Porphyromonas gingivalis]WKD53446.1 hypothetical protein NF669_04015 [Porphyromonas gingivalis]WKD55497.1 hypothetical protein NF668_04020 [Porphyromonas gingivalis]
MKRGTITIDERGNVHIPSTPVWMSACEIATLFGEFSGKVNSHIKSIFKESLLREDEVMQTLSFKGGAVDLYNLEMITMLSFRFPSPQAKLFRKWIISKLIEKKILFPPLIVYHSKHGWWN